MSAAKYLTPFRWYNQFYKQSRFEKDCDMVCGFDLITDKNHLLPFQFKRLPNPSALSDWFLIPACNDPFAKAWTDGEASFTAMKNWDVSIGNCGAVTDPIPVDIHMSFSLGLPPNVQLVNLTTGKTIGYTHWDTDFATTMNLLVTSVNTNTPNGTPFNVSFPFDNSIGFTATYDGVSDVFISAPSGSGSTYNGTTFSVLFDSSTGHKTYTHNPFAGGGPAPSCPTWLPSCGNIINNDSTTGAITYAGNPLIIGKEYNLFVTVSEWANPGTAFSVLMKNGATTIGGWSGPANSGVYYFTFTATATTFSIEFSNQTPGDYIIIDNVQILAPFILDASVDYTLDVTKLTLQNVGGTSGSDYIIYCNDNLGAIKPGSYYSMIRFPDVLGSEKASGGYVSEGYAYYFSEVITVKDFLPETSPYIRLDWYNSCDIDDVRYATTCYINRLYIDGILTRPEYPITEKGQTDGNEDFNPTFQKWNKKRSLEFSKVPEFLIDALTSIRLHDKIFIIDAVRDNQYLNIYDEFKIKSVEHDLQWIWNDCRATFILKCLIDDKVVDETCCTTLEVSECITCDVTADYYNDDSSTTEGASAIFEDFSAYTDGYYRYQSGSWVLQTGTEGSPIVCIPASCFMFTIQGGIWVRCPEITGYTSNPTSVGLVGRILANTYAQAQYSIDGGVTWTDVGAPINSARFKSFIHGGGIHFTRPSDSPGCGDTWYRVKMYDLNCVYCYSDHVVSTDATAC